MSSSTKEEGPKHPWEVHETSQWQEWARARDELTLWDIQRPPRKLVTKNRKIRCHEQTLNPFRCVICLGYLKEATIVMECLHRFCNECITSCIRIGSQGSKKVFCPTCRTPIPSRRSLRRDTKFDQIIKRTIGDPADFEKDDQLGDHSSNKMVKLQRAVTEKRRIVRQRKRDQLGGEKQQESPSFGTMTNFADLPIENIEDMKKSPLIELELRKHPHEHMVDRLERPFLFIRGDAKVSILKSFLNKKLDDCTYELSAKLDDESVVLDDELTLIEAKEALCTETSEPLVLKYRVAAAIDGGEDGEEDQSSELVEKDEKLEADEGGEKNCQLVDEDKKQQKVGVVEGKISPQLLEEDEKPK